jgi:hypothetical protein
MHKYIQNINKCRFRKPRGVWNEEKRKEHCQKEPRIVKDKEEATQDDEQSKKEKEVIA